MPFQKGHKFFPARKLESQLGKKNKQGRGIGAKNKRTLILERVYELCTRYSFHPAYELIKIYNDPETRTKDKIDIAKFLVSYIEGPQPQGKPLTPQTPEESLEAARTIMQELRDYAKPMEVIEVKMVDTNESKES